MEPKTKEQLIADFKFRARVTWGLIKYFASAFTWVDVIYLVVALSLTVWTLLEMATW